MPGSGPGIDLLAEMIRITGLCGPLGEEGCDLLLAIRGHA